ncbi:hypothetical protein CDD82_6931 [Ophiocordyceps australis]|uniref:Dystroglycan-type cadherin-like domain-containing protein n=1 Tax=Ophiocordyceps australis TaxID=1399860 RepID=A0A2C5YT16_9HYPO|nr:hypothetical protein CDD82_6931 [Ophiocordyceps australis]
MASLVIASLVMVSLVLVLMAPFASCQPVVTFPLNSQLPLAARANQPFSYSFSPATFTSDSHMWYSLGQHPSWLSLESNGRRLHGTPADSDLPPGDVVGQKVEVIATDDTGSTAMNATLVVSRNPAPKVEVPLSEQIERFGKFSAPSSILSYPSTEFKFSFDPHTFGSKGLNYYAASGDNSPLPSWISFDGPSLTFWGETPPFKSLIQPPHTFDFNLIASDIVGFSASMLQFSIVVGSHKLTMDKPVMTLNASRGSELRYSGWQDELRLDGRRVPIGRLGAKVDDLPAWLTFDSDTGALRGTPGSDAHSTNFTITFRDDFADTLHVVTVVNVASGLFSKTMDDVEAQAGSEFSIDLANYLRKPDDTRVEVATTPKQDWLETDGLNMSGRVPPLPHGGFDIVIGAASKSSNLKETDTLKVVVTGPTPGQATPGSAVPAPTQHEANGSPAASEDELQQSGSLSTRQILVATIVPILSIALLLLVVCLLRRRSKRRALQGPSYRANISKPPTKPPAAARPDDAPSPWFGKRSTKKPPEKAFVTVAPWHASRHGSSRNHSSDTLAAVSHSDHEPPPTSAGTATIRSVGTTERESWVTVEGDDLATVPSNEPSIPPSSQPWHSQSAFPNYADRLLPASSFTSDTVMHDLESGLDMAMSSVDNVASLQNTPAAVYRPQLHLQPSCDSLGANSLATYTSAAAPSTANSDTPRPQPNWESIAHSDPPESLSHVRALFGPPPAPSHQWYDVDSSHGSKSLATNTSFGSSENWRVVAPRPRPHSPPPHSPPPHSPSSRHPAQHSPQPSPQPSHQPSHQPSRQPSPHPSSPHPSSPHPSSPHPSPEPPCNFSKPRVASRPLDAPVPPPLTPTARHPESGPALSAPDASTWWHDKDSSAPSSLQQNSSYVAFL